MYFEEKTYENSSKAAESLFSVDKSVHKTRKEHLASRALNAPNAVKFLGRIGIEREHIDSIPYIHVTGTKGKGSTCALTERILREHGYKTGFFSSPHLMEPRERIRIAGRCLPRDVWNKYFWEVYDTLWEKQEFESDMPFPMQFFAVMMIKVFLEEKVDVAIVEVGVGGQNDSTNFLKFPFACGITTLDIDHINELGGDISTIAVAKAGIFKSGTMAFTLPQPMDGLNSIARLARERQCEVYIVPEISDYDFGDDDIKIGIPGRMQLWNASLAIQMANAFISRHHLSFAEVSQPYENHADFTGKDIRIAPDWTLANKTKLGLKNTVWPARHQIIRKDNVTYYLDGAHTVLSLQQCSEWFQQESEKEKNMLKGKVVKMLVFNIVSDRPEDKLLTPVMEVDFDGVVFCPNIIDNSNTLQDPIHAEDCLERCYNIRAVFLNKLKTSNDNVCNNHTMADNTTKNASNVHANISSTTTSNTPSHVANCLADALNYCGQEKDVDVQKRCLDSDIPALAKTLIGADHIQILVTGSMRLIGNCLHILDPNMNDRC